LAEAINEKAGGAITITEPTEEDGSDETFKSNSLVNGKVNFAKFDANRASSSSIDFKKIKLRYEVSVVFAIQ